MKQVLKTLVRNTLGALRAKPVQAAALQPLSQAQLRAVVGGLGDTTDSPRGNW